MISGVLVTAQVLINAQHLKGTTYVLTVFDLMGRVVFKDGSTNHGSTSPSMTGGYFTKDLDCSGFAKGMYIVNLQTNKEVLSKRFIKD